MYFCAVSAFNHVPVGHDAIDIDEKAAAARELFTAGIEGLDCHCGGFDAAD